MRFKEPASTGCRRRRRRPDVLCDSQPFAQADGVGCELYGDVLASSRNPQPAYQFSWVDSQGLGDFDDVEQADIAFATLDRADIRRVEVRWLRPGSPESTPALHAPPVPVSRNPRRPRTASSYGPLQGQYRSGKSMGPQTMGLVATGRGRT